MRNHLRAIPTLLLIGLWASAVTAQTGKTATGKPQTLQTIETAGPPATPPAARTPPAAPKCRLKVRSLQSRGSRRFSATRILYIDFHLRLKPPTAGERFVRIEIETPTGHLFQTLTIPFSDDPADEKTRQAVAGFPRPVEVQLMRQNSRRPGRALQEVVAHFPVAGTPIVHSSLYGNWVATAYVADNIEPCGRSRAFIINP